MDTQSNNQCDQRGPQDISHSLSNEIEELDGASSRNKNKGPRTGPTLSITALNRIYFNILKVLVQVKRTVL
jgi:hypothetical protein